MTDRDRQILFSPWQRNNQHKKWRYDDLLGLMGDKETLIHWLIAGLMAKERVCPMCDGEMSLARCVDRSDLFKWECGREEKSKRHKAEISIRKGGWFEKSKITLEEILKLTYWWCQDLDQAQIIKARARTG